MRFWTDAGVNELQRFANCVGEASLSFPFSRSKPSIRAILRPDVTGDEPAQHQRNGPIGQPVEGIVILRSPLSRLRPAGPPPTHTTSYISGFVPCVANVRRRAMLSGNWDVRRQDLQTQDAVRACMVTEDVGCATWRFGGVKGNGVEVGGLLTSAAPSPTRRRRQCHRPNRG